MRVSLPRSSRSWCSMAARVDLDGFAEVDGPLVSGRLSSEFRVIVADGSSDRADLEGFPSGPHPFFTRCGGVRNTLLKRRGLENREAEPVHFSERNAASRRPR